MNGLLQPGRGRQHLLVHVVHERGQVLLAPGDQIPPELDDGFAQVLKVGPRLAPQVQGGLFRLAEVGTQVLVDVERHLEE